MLFFSYLGPVSIRDKEETPATRREEEKLQTRILSDSIFSDFFIRSAFVPLRLVIFHSLLLLEPDKTTFAMEIYFLIKFVFGRSGRVGKKGRQLFADDRSMMLDELLRKLAKATAISTSRDCNERVYK
jgi:predicted phosphatase